MKIILTFILDGANTALGGIEKFQESYKKRDKIGMTISIITIFSGIATATGNPIGLAIALGLNLLKTGLTVGQKANEKPEESESDKLEKVIKKALSGYRETNLRAEWHGYERLSDLFSGNVELMAEFNEKKETDPEVEEIKNKELRLDDVKQSLFDIIVSRLYDVLMSSTVLLGKVQYEISEQCNQDVAVPRLKERRIIKAKKNPGTISEEDDDEEYAKKCLGLYELYGKMNFYRETKFLGHLDRIDNLVKEPTETAMNKLGFKTKQVDSKVNSHAYKLLILDVIRQMNENNKDVFKPLVNAFKNVKLRYLINYYHTHSKEYEYLKKYMENLDLKEEALKDVMFCRTEALTGSCTRITAEGAETGVAVPEFNFRSAFVPEGKMLKISYTTDVNAGIQKIGPSTMANMFYDEEINPVKNYAIESYTKKKDDRIVSMCTFPKPENGKPLVPLHKSVCTDKIIDINKDKLNSGKPKTFNTTKLRYGSDSYFGEKPIAVSTDETDIAYTAHKIFKIKKEELKIRWGPFFGPLKMEKGCGSMFWEEIKFYRYKSKAMTDKEQAEVKPVTDPELCKGKNILCDDKVIDTSYFLKICKEQGLKGYCQEIPLIKGQANDKIINLTRIGINIQQTMGTHTTSTDVSNDPDVIKKIPNSDKKFFDKNTAYDDKVDDCIWFERDANRAFTKEKVNLLRSMKVPDGMIVELYSEMDGRGEMFGPYEGPLTVDRVDGNDKGFGEKATYIKSIKILEKTSVVI